MITFFWMGSSQSGIETLFHCLIFSGSGGASVTVSSGKVYEINLFAMLPSTPNGAKLKPEFIPASMMTYPLPNKPSK